MVNPKSTPYLFATNGDGQSTTALESFATPLQVLVTSFPGFPMPNIEVTFLIVAPDGSNASASFKAGSQVLESSATTDANGYATCPSFTTGSSAGKLNVMVIYLSAKPVTFHLTVLPLPVASINVINGNNQHVTSTQKAQFAPLQVRLLDTAGNPAFDNDASKVAFGIRMCPEVTFEGGAEEVIVDTEQGVATAPGLTYEGSSVAFEIVASVADTPQFTTTFVETVVE